MGDGLLSSGLQALLKDADADPPAMITQRVTLVQASPIFCPHPTQDHVLLVPPNSLAPSVVFSWSIVKTKTSYYGFLETSLLFFNLKI